MFTFRKMLVSFLAFFIFSAAAVAFAAPPPPPSKILKFHVMKNVENMAGFCLPTRARNQKLDPNNIKLRVLVNYNGEDILRKDYRVGEAFADFSSKQAHPSGKLLTLEAWVLNGEQILKHIKISQNATFGGRGGDCHEYDRGDGSTVDMLEMGAAWHDHGDYWHFTFSLCSW